MKRLIKVLAVLAAVTALASALTVCGEKGGVIEVTNGTSSIAAVSVFKGLDILHPSTPKTIASGGKESFTFDEDGTYTVLSTLSLLKTFTKTVTLMGGSTQKVTVE